nr:MAG TPA: hypothetical protein [Caudoviricetes sp.]
MLAWHWFGYRWDILSEKATPEKIKNNQTQLFPFWKQLKNQQAVYSCKTAN